jgi:hypothetical protein
MRKLRRREFDIPEAQFFKDMGEHFMPMSRLENHMIFSVLVDRVCVGCDVAGASPKTCRRLKFEIPVSPILLPPKRLLFVHAR